MERLSKSTFKLRSGNKPSPMELSGVSPMKDGMGARMSDPPQYAKHYHNEKGNPVATGGFTTNEGAQHVSSPNKPKSPMTDKNPKILNFRTWKNEIWNKDNSYGQGLEIPDSYAKQDYREYVAEQNEKAGFKTDSKGRAIKND